MCYPGKPFPLEDCTESVVIVTDQRNVQNAVRGSVWNFSSKKNGLLINTTQRKGKPHGKVCAVAKQKNKKYSSFPTASSTFAEIVHFQFSIIPFSMGKKESILVLPLNSYIRC